MTEKKFRAWDTVEKKMIYVGISLEDLILNHFNKHDKLIWMQYTGKKDINNKEIYEGDILRYSIGGYIQNPPYLVEHIFEWLQEMNNTDTYYRWDNPGIVIGNIYI